MATIINNPDTSAPRESSDGNTGLILAIVIIGLLLIAFFAFGYRGFYHTSSVSNTPAASNSTNNSGSNGGTPNSGGSSGGSSNQGSISGQGTINYTK